VYTIDDLDKLHVQEDIRTTLQTGKNVVFPTETVYGIGANALSEVGVNNIYKIKGRPSDNPLIMHLSNTDMLEDYVYHSKHYVKELMSAFWPGPMTLVFHKKDIVPDYFTGGLNTVGVRIPGSDIARKVIDIANVPVCAPSANISGKPSSTILEHVLDDFNGLVDIIIDGGKSEVGLESTVIDVTGTVPVILRPGMITYDMIKNITTEVLVSKHIESDETPKSPGMKYKHYAPKGQLIIVDGTLQQVVEYINKQAMSTTSNYKVGVISTTEHCKLFSADFVYDIGSEYNEEAIASNVFSALRAMDSNDVDIIYSLSFDKGKYRDAIMNRMLKAANNNIVKL